VVVAATTGTGGVVSRSFLIGVYRPAIPPSEWQPWSESLAAERETFGVSGRFAIGIAMQGRPPERIDVSPVEGVGDKIRIQLPAPGDVVLVEVTLAGEDGVIGTADDIRLTGEAVKFSIDGSVLTVDLGSVAGPARIQFVIGGVVFEADTKR
jgi:hypothetical protein